MHLEEKVNEEMLRGVEGGNCGLNVMYEKRIYFLGKIDKMKIKKKNRKKRKINSQTLLLKRLFKNNAKRNIWRMNKIK